MLPPIPHRIATELSARPAQVEAAIALLDEGATVPFIARYRKEVTGGLDDTQLRTLEERLTYLRELEDRRVAVIESIESQGKMTDALREAVVNAETKQRLEDLYAPYKPKRRTKAMIAKEAGLEPLADALLADPSRVPEEEALQVWLERHGPQPWNPASWPGSRRPSSARRCGGSFSSPAPRSPSRLQRQGRGRGAVPVRELWRPPELQGSWPWPWTPF